MAPGSRKRGKPASRQEHKCTVCGKVFSRAEYVRRHYAVKHASSSSRADCTRCSASFCRADLLRRHVRVFHPDEEEAPETMAASSLDLPAPASLESSPSSEGTGTVSSAPDPPSEPTSVEPTTVSDSFIGFLGPLFGCSEFEAAHTAATSIEDTASASDAAARHPSPRLNGPNRLFLGSATHLPTTHDLPDAPSYPPHPPAAPDAQQLQPHFTGMLAEVTDEDLLAFLATTSSNLATASAPPSIDTAPSYFSPSTSLDLPPPLFSSSSLAFAQDRPRNVEFAVLALPGTAEDWAEEGKQSEEASIFELLMGGNGLHLKEPSMYPDQGHLWLPERGHGSRFFMPSQRFCTAYLFPFEIPPLPKLSRFAYHADSVVLPVLPLIHRPTCILVEIPPTLAFALSVIGAGLFQSASGFYREMSHIKREFAAEHVRTVILREDERVSSTQTLLLYQLTGCFSSREDERDYSRIHHPLLVEAFLSLTPPTFSTPTSLDLSPRELDRMWKRWVACETYIRIAFLCYLVDVEVGRCYGDWDRKLPHSHPALAGLPLPSHDSLWHAETAEAWRQAWQQQEQRASSSPSNQTPTFTDTLNALLSTTPLTHGSPAARALLSLSHRAPLAVTVLTQTLLSLQRQLAASQKQVIRNVASAAAANWQASGTGGGPLDMTAIETAHSRVKESQARIAFGLKCLRLLGGTAANERWFSGLEVVFS
ncbi:hypothetical protein JCM10207_003216 [Rhodosporidiobolus poonsookiae]